MRPYAARHGLTMLQLACAWNLAQPGVRCVAPTLIQEPGPGARPVEDKRAELAALRASACASASDELARDPRDRRQHRLHGAEGREPRARGPELPDRWPLDGELRDVAARWGIEPERDLVRREPMPAAG